MKRGGTRLTGNHDLYRAAGVDIDAASEAVERIRPHAARTMRKEVISPLGGFGAGFLFDNTKYEEPVLVSGTDGVGTKLKVAFAVGRHDTVGIDAVAMCVNDIAAMGAEPLFFLDYFATGSLSPAVMEQVVKGIAAGCAECGAALVGGETAEMPGMYAPGEYDIAGFAVGVVERRRWIDGHGVQTGDVLIGLPSSGAHANGFSLIRKLVADAGVGYADQFPGGGKTVGDVLLTPTRLYTQTALRLREIVDVRGMAHITGGGLQENVPRVLPAGLGCVLDTDRWPVPAVFDWLRALSAVPAETCYRTWNMGIGFVFIVPDAQKADALSALAAMGETAYEIGRVVDGAGVRLAGGGAR